MDRKTLLLRMNQQRQRQTSELIPSAAKEAVIISDVSAWQAHQQVRQYQQKWRTEQTTLMLAECRQRLLQSIIGPFGLGTIVSAWDKVGGMLIPFIMFASGFMPRKRSKCALKAAVSTTAIHTISTTTTRRPMPKTVKNRMQAKQWMLIPDRH